MATSPDVNLGVRILKGILAYLKDKERVFWVSLNKIHPHGIYVGKGNKLTNSKDIVCIDGKARNIEKLLYDTWHDTETDIFLGLEPMKLVEGGIDIASFDTFSNISPAIVKSGDCLYLSYSIKELERAVANHLYDGILKGLTSRVAESPSSGRGRLVPPAVFRKALLKDSPRIEVDFTDDATVRSENGRNYYCINSNRYLAPVVYNLSTNVLGLPCLPFNFVRDTDSLLGYETVLKGLLNGVFGETLLGHAFSATVNVNIKF